MKISINYIVVEKIVEEKKEGFQAVEVQDSFVYKGKVVNLPDPPVYIGNEQIKIGDVIMFAKYSPDTFEMEVEGQKVKFVNVSDILAIL